MGDLFDKTTISNHVLLKTIEILENSLKLNPNTLYYILAGNHDLVKDVSKVSSFDLLVKYFTNNYFSNLKIISKETIHDCYLYLKDTNLLFIPYLPFDTVDSLINENNLPLVHNKETISFGHWDIIDFEKLTGIEKLHSNKIPSFILDISDKIYTGHEHKPKKSLLNNKEIIVTGSMQPYAHGEELSTESLYLTQTLQEFKNNYTIDVDYYSSVNLRIILDTSKNEVFEVEDLNCLSLTFIIKKEDKITTTKDDSELNKSISFNDLFINFLQTYINDTTYKEYVENIQSHFLNRDFESISK